MEFVRRAQGVPKRLGVLPGTFNPITIAHLALAHAAQGCCDEVVFVLPRTLPHKEYSGASFAERLELLEAALGNVNRVSVAVADAGLFVEIAAECRQAYGPDVRLAFLCGRDAAERIAAWDYGSRGRFSSMLGLFDILVADRDGEYTPPRESSPAIQKLELVGAFDHVSASQVRERLTQGDPWEHLVPSAVRERVRQIYGRSRPRD
ncbi:MAG: hypothetical protein LAP40_26365 [Acidobacteriia bacterium]|nr:hypothetical protein [Terriglobia bacterium]